MTLILLSTLALPLLSQAKTTAAIPVVQNKWGMKLIKIPAGEFQMGLQDYTSALMDVPEPKENELRDELPRHTVKISGDFYIGQTEVTQKQWLAIMENKPGPEKYWKQANWESLPVVSINWYMAQRFVEEINKLDKEYAYRLPSEAEWEYVARAGSTEDRPIETQDLESHAWFINNSGDEQQPVASRKANAFGAYDMLGNVWEWVGDWYGPNTYTQNSRQDPLGPGKGKARVRRGGSYHCQVHLMRPGYRAANKPGVAYEVTGFRVVAEKK